MSIADSIAQLFLDRFRPMSSDGHLDGAAPIRTTVRSALTESEFDRRYAELSSKISVLQIETAREVFFEKVLGY